MSVARITLGSPPWNPHATFADVMYGKTASSAPMRYAPKLSPMSQFRSTRLPIVGSWSFLRVVERDRRSRLRDVGLASKVQRLGVLERDEPKAQPISGLELRDERKVHARDVTDARIAA